MPIANGSLTAAAVKQQATALGFDLCGIAPAAALPELAHLQPWLDAGHAGEMEYLRRTAERRRDVRVLLPEARSVIVFGTIYNTARPYSVDCTDPGQAAIARYAWGDDYHIVIQSRLDAMLEWLSITVGTGFDGLAYVDTGPVQERVYAQYAGIGWIGKNTCVINPELGSWIFLSEIICNVPLQPDVPVADLCGACTMCIDACPTGALTAPRTLDARRCLSYLTIEIKGAIPIEQRAALSSHAYGCDICQEVCPYNAAPATSADPTWAPREGLDGASLIDLWRRSDEELQQMLRGSAMKRAGIRRLRRNLAVAIGNSRDAAAIPALEARHTATCEDPLVEEHVRWAVETLRG